MTTKEIIEQFLAGKGTPTIAHKLRRQLDRPELYEYEQEIGKQLIEWNADEIMEFLAHKLIGADGKPTPFATIYAVTSSYRNVVDWYNKSHTPVYNAWHDKRFRAHDLSVTLAEHVEPYTTEDMEDFIRGVRRTYDEDRADYVELMVRLFYYGIPKATDIISIKEEDINHKTKSIRLLDYRVIPLDAKTYNLAMRVHNIAKIDGRHYDYVMVSYHDSFFKVPVIPREVDLLNGKDITVVSGAFHKCIRAAMKDSKYPKNISYITFFYLGFYDFLVREYGRENANAILTSNRDKAMAGQYLLAAKRYGISDNMLSQFKSKIMAFIRQD